MNCGKCGAPACMVFALRIGERDVRPEDCPLLDKAHTKRICEYLERFEPVEQEGIVQRDTSCCTRSCHVRESVRQ